MIPRRGCTNIASKTIHQYQLVLRPRTRRAETEPGDKPSLLSGLPQRPISATRLEITSFGKPVTR